jgi:predicted Zn-dependent protease
MTSSAWAVDSNDARYSRALLLMGDKQYNEALPLLLSLKKEFPADSRVLYRIAECHAARNDAAAALEHCALAIAADEQYEDPYVLQFNIYNQQKNYQEASDTLLDMLRNTHNNIEYWYTLGKSISPACRTRRLRNMPSTVFTRYP